MLSVDYVDTIKKSSLRRRFTAGSAGSSFMLNHPKLNFCCTKIYHIFLSSIPPEGDRQASGDLP